VLGSRVRVRVEVVGIVGPVDKGVHNPKRDWDVRVVWESWGGEVWGNGFGVGPYAVVGVGIEVKLGGVW
jgi:hypothetical protein